MIVMITFLYERLAGIVVVFDLYDNRLKYLQ